MANMNNPSSFFSGGGKITGDVEIDGLVDLDPLAVGVGAEFVEDATVVGVGAKALDRDTSAFGRGAEALAPDATALGTEATAPANWNTVVGYDAGSSQNGENVVLVGRKSEAQGDNAVGIGETSRANARNATAVGRDTSALSENASAFGRAASATAVDSSVFGQGGDVSGEASTIVGQDASVSADNAAGIGQGISISGDGAVGLGKGISLTLPDTVAFGSNVTVEAEGALAVGANATASGVDSTAIGKGATADADNAIAIGDGTEVQTSNSLGFGDRNFELGDGRSIRYPPDSETQSLVEKDVDDALAAGTQVGYTLGIEGAPQILVGAEADGSGGTQNVRIEAREELLFPNIGGSPNFSGHTHGESGMTLIPNSGIANSSITITAGSGIVSSGEVSLGDSTTVDFAGGSFLSVTQSSVDVNIGFGIEGDGSDNIRINEGFSPTWTASHTFNSGFTLGDRIDMSDNKITNLPSPTQVNDAARKGYVDGVAEGLNLKNSVVAATDGTEVDLTSSSDPNPIDGVTLSDGNRVLLKNQSDATENGVYEAQTATDPSTWVRATDFNESDEVNSGAFTFVNRGDVNGSTSFIVTTNDPVDLGTDNINFSQFSEAGQFNAGLGLDLDAQTFSVVAADLAGDFISPDTNGAFQVNLGNGLEDDSTSSIRIDPQGIAGNFLSESGSTNLSVNVGNGVESDGSDNLRVDTSAIAGNGLVDESTSALAVAASAIDTEELNTPFTNLGTLVADPVAVGSSNLKLQTGNAIIDGSGGARIELNSGKTVFSDQNNNAALELDTQTVNLAGSTLDLTGNKIKDSDRRPVEIGDNELRLQVGRSIEDSDDVTRLTLGLDSTTLKGSTTGIGESIVLQDGTNTQLKTTTKIKIRDNAGAFSDRFDAFEYDATSSSPGVLNLLNANLDLQNNKITEVNELELASGADGGAILESFKSGNGEGILEITSAHGPDTVVGTHHKLVGQDDTGGTTTLLETLSTGTVKIPNGNLRFSSGQGLENGNGQQMVTLGTTGVGISNADGRRAFETQSGSAHRLLAHDSEPVRINDEQGDFTAVSYLSSSSAPGVFKLANARLEIGGGSRTLVSNFDNSNVHWFEASNGSEPESLGIGFKANSAADEIEAVYIGDNSELDGRGSELTGFTEASFTSPNGANLALKDTGGSPATDYFFVNGAGKLALRPSEATNTDDTILDIEAGGKVKIPNGNLELAPGKGIVDQDGTNRFEVEDSFTRLRTDTGEVSMLLDGSAYTRLFTNQDFRVNIFDTDVDGETVQFGSDGEIGEFILKEARMDFNGNKAIDAGHDRVDVPQVQERTVADFETGALPVETISGSSNFSVEAGNSFDGDFALVFEGSGRSSIEFPNRGVYPQEGDTITYYTQLTSPNDISRFRFAKEEAYEITVRADQNLFAAFVARGSGGNFAQSDPKISDRLNEWLEVTLQFGKGDPLDVTATLRDSSGEIMAQFSDTTNIDGVGNFQFDGVNTSGNTTEILWDAVTLKRRETEDRARTQQGITQLGNEVSPSGVMNVGSLQAPVGHPNYPAINQPIDSSISGSTTQSYRFEIASDPALVVKGRGETNSGGLRDSVVTTGNAGFMVKDGGIDPDGEGLRINYGSLGSRLISLDADGFDFQPITMRGQNLEIITENRNQGVKITGGELRMGNAATSEIIEMAYDTSGSQFAQRTTGILAFDENTTDDMRVRFNGDIGEIQVQDEAGNFRTIS